VSDETRPDAEPRTAQIATDHTERADRLDPLEGVLMPTSLSRRVLVLLTPIALLAACGDDGGDPAAEDQPDDASVSFVSPSDGDHVAGGVALEMEANGLTIEPAGEVREGAGHFHVIADDGCVAPGAAVAKDADHVHFGKGQSEGTIYLAPGEHELCLQPGDGAHVALDLTDRVTVVVGVESRDDWCGVIEEVDDLFATADSSSEDFAVRQVQYEGIRRLLAQVTDGIEQVDEANRPDVAAAIAQASDLAGTFADAADATAAETALRAEYGTRGAQPSEAAAAWILDTCEVDINS
jgi:hypothetical protein